MTLRRYLLSGYGIVLATVLIGFILILLTVIALGESPARIVDTYYQSIRAANQMTAAVQIQQNAILRSVLNENYPLNDQLAITHTAFVEGLAQARRGIVLHGERTLVEMIAERYRVLQEIVADRALWSGVYPWETNVVSAFQAVIAACGDLAVLNANAMLNATQSARGQVRQVILIAGIVAAAVLVISVVMALVLAHRVSRPLEQMVEGARRIAGGDYRIAEIPHSTISELAQLGRQFNRMATALQRFRAMDLERVLNEQRQSAAILRSIDDGLVIFGQDGRINRLNPVACRQLGLHAGQCSGRRLGELLDDTDADSVVLQSLRQQDENEQSPVQELAIETALGMRYLSYSVQPILDDVRQCQGAVMILHDISAHKAFEQMRTEFVMRASHELRTPVTSICMGIAMLTERVPFPEGSRDQELLTTVAEELDRLLRLVNDLFDLSRIQAGRRTIQLTPTCVNELLAAAQQRFALKTADRGIVLVRECASDLPEIALDRDQFDRVLDNLLNNALRHTPGGGQIVLRGGQSGTRIVIEVGDTGCGIDYAQQRRIFEPFVQISDTHDGAGLGLAICREIVQQHTGEITLRSRAGSGSTFRISLPI